MPELTSESLKNLAELLDAHTTAGPWFSFLELLEPTGVADMLQIQEALNLSRDKVRRLMDQMKTCTGDHPELFTILDFSTKRAGVRGRTPNIIRLGPSGAALLRLRGYKQTRHCLLDHELEIQHAVLMVDIRLAALKAGFKVITDREISYGDKACIRPDNQVLQPNGTICLFETEQIALPQYTRRITESLKNKIAFFSNSQRPGVSPIIRMVINVTRGKDWERTINIWKQVCQILSEAQPLPFKLFAITQEEFTAKPDWTEETDPVRWTDLSAPRTIKKENDSSSGMNEKTLQPPKLLFRQTPQEDHIVLQALWQQFIENNSDRLDSHHTPSPAFFETMCLIHSASFSNDGSGFSSAALPRASIFLLNQYLRMHPVLKKSLQKSIARGVATMRWNTVNILHRMQVIIERFLYYHGWYNGPAIQALAGTYNYNSEEGTGFCITVKIHNPWIMAYPDGFRPTDEEVLQAEKALAWVLWALFSFPEDLDLPYNAFW